MSDTGTPTPQPQEPAKQVIPTPTPQSAHCVISADQLSPYERKVLEEKFGYDGSEPVPSDLADRMGVNAIDSPEQKFGSVEEAVTKLSNSLPPGYTPPSKDLEIPAVQQVDDATIAEAAAKYADAVSQKQAPIQVPPKKNAAFQDALKSGVGEINAIRESGNIRPEVRQAAAILDQEAYENVDLGGADAASTEEATEETEDPEALAARVRKRNQEKLLTAIKDRTTEEDKDQYRMAVCTFRRFERSYQLLGGAIEVTFADYGANELEMARKQQQLDQYKGRLTSTNLDTVNNNFANYELAACLRKVHVKGSDDWQESLRVDIPPSQTVLQYLETYDLTKLNLSGVEDDDTPLRYWYRYLAEYALAGAAMPLIFSAYQEFSNKMIDLRILAAEPDFF